jgi:hypothetical protein
MPAVPSFIDPALHNVALREKESIPVFTAYLVVTIAAAIATIYAATVDFLRSESILDNMKKYGVPQSWLFSLGALKAAGALGLLVGIAMPVLGIAASIGLILYFIGAIVTVLRARWYSHLSYPAPFLLLAAASLVLQLATS